jgi:uncharacterized protein YcfL
MLRRYTLLLLIIPLLAAAVSCTPPNTQNSYERDKPTYQANVVKDQRIETDANLAARCQVLRVTQATVQGDMMKIQVEILNNDSVANDFDYRFEWFDGAGMQVDSPGSTWNTQHFGPQEVKGLQSIAPTPQCKDFRLKIQQNQRG